MRTTIEYPRESEPPLTLTAATRGMDPTPVRYATAEQRPEEIARAMAAKVQWSELNTKQYPWPYTKQQRLAGTRHE